MIPDSADLLVPVPIRPFSLNAERKGNRWEASNKTIEARDATAWMVKSMIRGLGLRATPLFHRVKIEVWPWALNKRYRQDIGNCYPSAKACIDGLVDARVLENDSDEHLVELTFRPHQFGRDELLLAIWEV